MKLLVLAFALAAIMVVVAVLMWRRRGDAGIEGVTCHRDNLPKVLAFGFATGALSGFFGIGGGFLIVPALMLAARMDLKEATGASLIAVAAFGLASASSYAWSGLIDWPTAGLLIAGGAAGALAGTQLNALLADRRVLMTRVFAGFVISAGLYVGARGVLTLMA